MVDVVWILFSLGVVSAMMFMDRVMVREFAVLRFHEFAIGWLLSCAAGTWMGLWMADIADLSPYLSPVVGGVLAGWICVLTHLHFFVKKVCNIFSVKKFLTFFCEKSL
jgi:hypothetical protein